MPKVRFTKNFNFVRQQVTVAYKAGMKLLVTTPCAREAIAAGAAVPLEEGKKAAPAPLVRKRK